MLWYKAWLEVRWRFLVPLALTLGAGLWLVPGVAGFLSPAGDPLTRLQPQSAGFRAGLNMVTLFIWPLIAITLAGSGVNTQSHYTMRAGIHPSMLFTLSLPVTRRRLLGVRAALGAVLLAAIIGVQCLFLTAASRLAVADMGLYAVGALAAALLMYSVAVLLLTVVDELRAYQIGCFVLLGVMMLRISGKKWFASVDVFRMMGDLSYAMTGRMPWGMLAVCAGISLALIAAAVVVVERKEY